MKKIKFLKKTFKNNSGRNNTGKITVRSRGGSKIKKSYRSIDFFRSIWFQKAKIVKIEYDPFRNAPIALINCLNLQIFFYVIKTENINLNSTIETYPTAKVFVGNSLIIKNIPTGVNLNNIEIYEKQGSQFARSGGAFCQIIKKSKFYSIIKLKSSKLKKISNKCFATIGKVSINLFVNKNLYHGAGRNRLKGWRPKVRGLAMNPIDHPHGGGKGKKSGKAISMSPWGKLIKGKKTRRKYNEIKVKGYIYK